MTTSETPTRSGLMTERSLRYLADHRKGTAYALFGISALGLVLAYFAYLHVAQYLAVCMGAALLALVALVGAVWQLAQETSGPANPDETRVLVLAVGGLMGLVVSLTAVVQGWHWRDIFLGGVEKWQSPD